MNNTFLSSRASKTFDWWPSDSLENYKEKNNLYGKDDIKYSFNSHGFRCDEFSEPSSYPVIFFGCSITEGIGVNLNETWASTIHKRICNKVGDIPFWNIAIGGTGIDTHASSLYWITKSIKPKLIIGYVPPFFRREYKYKNNDRQFWSPSSANNYSEIDLVMSDQDFISYQADRSLMIIDSLRRATQCRVILGHWADIKEDIELVQKYPDIIQVPQGNGKMSDYGRDGSHPGPATHLRIANQFWSVLNSTALP